MEEIVSLISNVGFPIACCIALYIQNNKMVSTLGEINATLKVMQNEITELKGRN